MEEVIAVIGEEVRNIRIRKIYVTKRRTYRFKVMADKDSKNGKRWYKNKGK